MIHSANIGSALVVYDDLSFHGFLWHLSGELLLAAEISAAVW